MLIMQILAEHLSLVDFHTINSAIKELMKKEINEIKNKARIK